MRAIAVITARSGSSRVPWKNMLPMGGVALAEIAVRQALGLNIRTVLTSDINALLQSCAALGAFAVKRPAGLAGGDRHLESVRHAVEELVSVEPDKKGLPVVLLQPSSPFRLGNIIEKCIEEQARNPSRVVYSGKTLNYADKDGVKVSGQVWDGCVAVYPHDAIEKPSDPLFVENEHANTLQVDTEEDYIQACVQNWRLNGCVVPFGREEALECVKVLSPILKGKKATLVARPDGKPIDQENPVIWVNHCVGWDGGRSDVVVVVASKNIVKVGINGELTEAAAKAQVVVIRDFGQAEWVVQNIKTTARVFVISKGMYEVTTGCFASILAWMSGGRVERLGFQRGVKRIPYCMHTMPNAKVSDEIAMLEVSGRERL